MFWAIHLIPKKPVTLTPQLPLQITQASLGLDAADDDKRKNTVLCTVDNQTHVLCSLRGAGTDQVGLNLMFESDKEFTLNVHGDTTVHLVGYCVPDEELDDEGDPASYNKDPVTVVPADLTKFVGKADSKQLEAKKQNQQISTKKTESELPKKKGEQDNTEHPKKNEHQKAEQQQTPKKTEQQTPKKVEQPSDQPEVAKDGQTPKNKKKRKGADANGQVEAPPTPSTPSTPSTPTPVASPSDNASFKTPEKQSKKARADTPVAKPSSAPQRKRLPNGLEIEDVVLGTGKQAAPGKKVSVMYVGRLQSNGKKFDASVTPFTFRLGVGEVIKGWDYGVAGMKIGGKRKLIIPAELAYGKRGAPPDIPPNAPLVFDVSLVNC